MLVRVLDQSGLHREKARKPSNSRKPKDTVTNAVRREVLKRDGLGCSFVDEQGRRCGSAAFLEFDHRRARGKGGRSSADNLRLLCRAAAPTTVLPRSSTTVKLTYNDR